LRGTYPPGSTFKPFMAIAALNTGKRAPSTIIYDNGVYNFGGHKFRSAEEGGLGPVDMVKAIEQSSNVYFYSLANDMGVDLIHDQLEPFGLGRRTGIDLEGEVTGVLPSTEWKRRTYKRPELKKWYPGETISLGIGQGYNNFTMLQMANGLSTLVSGGLRFKPRLVREVEDVVTRARRRIASDALEPLPLKPENVALIRRAMHGVTVAGTSMRVFANAGYASGGKTGTAQAVTMRQNEKYNASKVDEHKRDHSLYEAFAPADDPQIVLAVIVENAGFGAQAAAPIARRVFDYFLLGKYPSPEDLAATRLGQSGPPIGTPRAAADVPLSGATVVMGGIEAATNAVPITIPLSAATAASAGKGVQGVKPAKVPVKGGPVGAPAPAPEAPLPIAPLEQRDLPPEEVLD